MTMLHRGWDSRFLNRCCQIILPTPQAVIMCIPALRAWRRGPSHFRAPCLSSFGSAGRIFLFFLAIWFCSSTTSKIPNYLFTGVSPLDNVYWSRYNTTPHATSPSWICLLHRDGDAAIPMALFVTRCRGGVELKASVLPPFPRYPPRTHSVQKQPHW